MCTQTHTHTNTCTFTAFHALTKKTFTENPLLPNSKLGTGYTIENKINKVLVLTDLTRGTVCLIVPMGFSLIEVIRKANAIERFFLLLTFSDRRRHAIP
jgi:hypothetical protein